MNPFVEPSCSFAGLFGLCEFGERFRLAFDEIHSMIQLKINWYLVPVKAQKILAIMLIVTEKPVELDIFGSTSSNRNISKVVGYCV